MSVNEELEKARTLAEDGKKQIIRDLIMKRYSVTREDEEKWLANFDSDLEEYVKRRISLTELEKATTP